jgi:cell division protein FtsL
MTQTAHAIAYNVNKALRYRERIVLSLAAVAVFLFATYIFFVRSAIVNVVTRQTVAKEIQTDSTAVSSLENQYFNLKNSITMDTATSLGFSQATVSAFIPVSPSVAISSNDEI